MGETAKRIKRNLTIIIILTICLLLITFQSAYAGMTSGTHLINLNDGNPVIEEYSYSFAPGKSIEKEFFIENLGEEPLYYRLFFDKIEGTLGEYLDVTIIDENNIIMAGQMKDLKKNSTTIEEKYLAAYERKQLHIIFTLPQNVGDEAKNKSVEFDMRAIAVLAKDRKIKE